MYTVSQAEGLTGIPSTTLRAWERRYGIIAPRRTEGGYRLYDAAQIATLREMAARVQGGMRPAQAAASLIDQQPPTPTPATPLDAGTPDLVAAAASLDPAALRELVAAPSAYQQLRQSTRQRYERELNWSVVGKMLADGLQELVEAKKK